MARDKWWTVDDSTVFGPVAVYVGEAARHQGDYLYARWETEDHLGPAIDRDESLLLLDRDGATIEIGCGYVYQVVRPQGDLAGKVRLVQNWREGATTLNLGPATPDSD
jgi:hypothetical protein